MGGYAVSRYGIVRATGDLDVWVESTVENGRRLVGALQEFGFRSDALRPELFAQASQVIRMGVPPLRIELLTTISGMGFAECYARRLHEEWAGTPVDLISFEDLLENRRASGRRKDLLDLEQPE